MPTKRYAVKFNTNIYPASDEKCPFCGFISIDDKCGNCGDISVMRANYEQWKLVPYQKPARRTNRE